MRFFVLKILPAMLIWVFTAQAAWPAMYLALIGEKSDRALVRLPVEAGMVFHLEFINSIYLVNVRESFTCHAITGISLVSVESPSPSVFEYYDLVPQKPGKAYLSRSVGEIRLLSHDYKNHLLIVGDRTIHLQEYVPNGKSLIIRMIVEERNKD